MKGIYALYWTPEAAQRAVDALKEAGIAERGITVFSSEPLEEYAFGQRDRSTWMSWIAVFGGLCGLTLAYLLTSVTQKLWPINTGGMPIVTNWSNMIVVFELTMLGAVLLTVITLLVSARLPGRLPALYDPEVSEGKILVGVANPKEPELVEHALRNAGRATVRHVE